MNHLLSIQAQRIIVNRYAKRKADGTLETWDEICERVVAHVAEAEDVPHQKEIGRAHV